MLCPYTEWQLQRFAAGCSHNQQETYVEPPANPEMPCCCRPVAAAALPEPQPLGVRIPPLDGSRKPNFIIILTDDQGYDDLGIHQPQRPDGKPTWVNTPNQDRFFRRGMEFSNFYVSPMCSQSRAMLLTGRDYQRTGTMLINGGAGRPAAASAVAQRHTLLAMCAAAARLQQAAEQLPVGGWACRSRSSTLTCTF